MTAHRRRTRTRQEVRNLAAEIRVEFPTDTITEAMELVGIDPALIHAFRATGFLPTEQTLDLFSAEDLAEWNAAIEEFEASQGLTKGAGV